MEGCSFLFLVGGTHRVAGSLVAGLFYVHTQHHTQHRFRRCSCCRLRGWGIRQSRSSVRGLCRAFETLTASSNRLRELLQCLCGRSIAVVGGHGSECALPCKEPAFCECASGGWGCCDRHPPFGLGGEIGTLSDRECVCAVHGCCLPQCIAMAGCRLDAAHPWGWGLVCIFWGFGACLHVETCVHPPLLPTRRWVPHVCGDEWCLVCVGKLAVRAHSFVRSCVLSPKERAVIRVAERPQRLGAWRGQRATGGL